MFGIVGYPAFLAATVALCLTPGVDTVYILTRSLAGGRREGLASALGVSTGLLVHTVLVATGLSLLLAASELAFTVVKVAGATYLVVMGVRSIVKALRGEASLLGASAEGEKPARGVWRTYGEGVLTNVLNPKIILFFLALLPGFVGAGNAYGAVPFLLLGLTYTAVSTIWTCVLVLLASPLSGLLNGSERASQVTGVVSGAIYVVLGGAVLVTSRT